VNLDRLADFGQGSEVDPEAMAQAGLIKSSVVRVKVLGRGELKHALTISAHKFSASAKEKIEAAGGTVVELGLEGLVQSGS
jgi:large subunit ribosomal protein L15